MGRISNFLKLPLASKMVFGRALYLLVASSIGLHKVPFKTLLARLPHPQQMAPGPDCQAIDLDHILWLFKAACRLIPLTTCLSRALAGYQLLCRHGHVPALHIGVAKDCGQDLEAHAWLTMGEEIIIGHLPDLARYRQMPPLPLSQEPSP